MIIADTSAWIDFFRGVEAPHVASLENALLGNELFIGDLIIAELLQGARSEKSIKAINDVISKLTHVDMVGFDNARKSAANYRDLRSMGITVRKTIDMLIATYCIENNGLLIHNDRDFDPIEQHLGLKVIH